MTNTGTAIPAMKLGETDTLIKFSTGGPGDDLRNIVKGPDGAYYATIAYQNKIHKLDSSGAWTEFADLGTQIYGMAMDRSGNLYANTSLYVKKITPDGTVSNLAGLPMFGSGNALAIDADNNLLIADGSLLSFSLPLQNSTFLPAAVGQMRLDHSPYIDYAYGDIDMDIDSKGNIYLYRVRGNGILKIKPNGQKVGIGRLGSNYYEFKPGNGTDAMIPDISSMAIDSTNDNVYLMAYGKILRVDTAENVTQLPKPGLTIERPYFQGG
jgi:sugar lactone lactonase YvrE